MERKNKIRLLQLVQAGMSVEQAEDIADIKHLILIDRNGILTGCLKEPVNYEQVKIIKKFVDVRIIKKVVCVP